MPRIILYNIQYCAGLKGSWEYLKFWKMFFTPKYLDYVIANELKKHKPDIVGFIEIDTGSIRARKKDSTKFFRDFLDFHDQAERIKYDKRGFSGIMKILPITRKQGNAIISKYYIEDVKYHHLKGGTKKIVIETLIKKPHRFKVLLVHLPLGKNARKKQLDQLAEIANSIDGPFIMMGDFNILDGIKEIRPLLRKTRLKLAKKKPYEFTQPTMKPKKMLDLILTSDDIKVNDYKILEDMEYSDHLPVMVDFDIEKK